MRRQRVNPTKPAREVTANDWRDRLVRGQTRLAAWHVIIARVVQRIGWKRSFVAVIAVLALLADLTTVLDGAVERTVDGCRKLGLCDPIPPPVLAGTLTEVRVGAAGITLAEAYAERNVATPADLPPETGQWPGRIITYRLELQGLEDAVCRIRWTLYDALTGKRLPSPTSRWDTTHVPAFPDGVWIVEARQSDVIVGVVWVPYVAAGTFIVELELLNAKDQYMDIERTEPFTVAAAEVPAA